LRVVHALPGRIRVKLDALRGDKLTAQAVRDVVGDLVDVAYVEVSEKTGSVLVEYEDGTTTSRRLAELAAAVAPLAPDMGAERIAELMAVGPQWKEPMQASETVRAAMSSLNGGVATLTGGPDLAFLVPAGLTAFGVGALLLGEGVLLPEWYTFLWFAFGTWVALNAAAPLQSPATMLETAPL
jgi:hypothetical protein